MKVKVIVNQCADLPINSRKEVERKIGSMTDTVRPFTVVIPARFGSSRLPGKPLADIGGKSMVRHVYERASESRGSKGYYCDR